MQVRRFSGSQEDWQLIHNICFNCSSTAVKSSFSYIGRLIYFDPSKIIFDIFDDIAFFFGCTAKKHIRCIVIAVHEDYQKSGIGKEILFFEQVKATQKGLHQITLRTPKNEKGLIFWQKMGAKIIGEKGTDWEMQLDF